MRKFIASLLVPLFLFASVVPAYAARVRGYVTKKGTYVQSYNRSASNRTKVDNYSSRGNYNPYTSKKGYKKW